MKGTDKVMDPYFPISWKTAALELKSFTELKRKSIKSMKKYVGMYYMWYYARDKYSSIHPEFQKLYKELYEGIGLQNRNMISKSCSPKFAMLMEKRIQPDIKSSIIFHHINTNIENVYCQVPDSPFTKLRSLTMPDTPMDNSFKHIFQVTVSVDSEITLKTLDGSALLENEKMSDVVVMEMSKVGSRQFDWRLCGMFNVEKEMQKKQKVENAK